MTTQAALELLETNHAIDITAIDMLSKLRNELTAKNITFAMARVKQDLYLDLKRAGFLKDLKYPVDQNYRYLQLSRENWLHRYQILFVEMFYSEDSQEN